MPANNSIAINDGASTPVAHTFTPAGYSDPQTADFRERKDSLVEEPLLQVFVRKPTAAQSTRRATVKLSLPSVQDQVINGVTQKVLVYKNIASADLVFDQGTPKQARKDLRVLLANALLNASVGLAVDESEYFW